MSQIIKKDDGTEEEVFSASEIEEKLKVKEAELNQGFEIKIKELNEDKKKIEEDITKGGSQGENFKILKAALDKKDSEIGELRTSIQKNNDDRISEYRDGVITKLSNGNKELEKKILHNFNETLKGIPANSTEEITNKINSAYKLSVDIVSPDLLNAALQGGQGRSLSYNSGNVVELTPAQIALGNKLGISDEDRKKYTNDPRFKNTIK